MSNEIQAFAPPGLVIYAFADTGTGATWNGLAFETFDPAHWPAYALPVPESPPGSGGYLGNFPALAPAGLYPVRCFWRSGAAPVPTDTALTGQIVTWPGPTPTPTPAPGGGAAVDAVLYCTDEDIAVRCGADFPALCPRWQSVASAADGVFAPGAPRVMTSPTADLTVLEAGHVLNLKGPRPQFTGDGVLFAVAAQSAGSVVLRRVGFAPPRGPGSPPVSAAGLAGVTFECATLRPQISGACLDLNNQLGIDPNLPLRNPAAVYDPNRELVAAAVLTVLQRQYATEARDGRGDFVMKLKQVEADLSAVKARLTLRWGKTGDSEVADGVWSTQRRR